MGLSAGIRLFPVLLRPKALAFKNYWQLPERDRTLLIRDAVILMFGAGVMYGIFSGGIWMLAKLQTERAMVYFHPSVPLGLMLIYLFLMLLLSNSATAIASLYLSHDLDLVLSSPIRQTKFFWGKFLDTLFSSTWVTMVFILPAIYSFARYYHAPPSYYFAVLLILLPYFVIPTALSMIWVTIYCRFVPATRTREVLFLLSICGAIGMYAIFQMLFPSGDGFSFRSMEDVLRLVAILGIPNTQWAPSYWASTCLAELLAPTKSSSLPHFILLYSVAIALTTLAYLMVRIFHFEAYSKALSHRRQVSFNSKVSQSRWRRWFPVSSPQIRAQVTKDFKLFIRDPSQLFQLLLLSGISVLYFYNFRLIHGIQAELPEETRRWWGVFIFMVNTYIEAFLMTAVGTRFVFQAVSLEGRSFWVLQSSPLSLRRFLRTKFFTWLVPVSLILGAVFGIGAHAVGAPAYVVALKIVSSWIVCCGIIGLGIGLGAYYSNFAWEHSTQLAASFGSLVYMLVCVALVTLDMAIVGLILLFRYYYETDPNFGMGPFIMGAGAAGLLFVYVNLWVSRWALGFGEAELVRRMS